MLRITTLLLALLALPLSIPCQAGPRSTVSLDPDWKFTRQEGAPDWASASFDDSGWDTVSLPHTWNAFDGQSGDRNYYRGTGWYRRHFRLPPEAAGRRVLLEFDGASRVTDVFVNGRAVGSHAGAFARFRFDVTDVVSAQGDNVLAVRVNNAPGGIIPLGGDFTQCGGLYRRVRLLFTEPVHIATLDHGSPGIFLTQRAVTAERAEVEARVQLANDSRGKVTATVRVRIQAADGTPVATATAPVSLEPGARSEVVLPIALAKPHLWNGVADPYCYRATVDLGADDRLLDTLDQPLGLRSYVAKPDAGFFLNGSRYELHGVNRHQERLDQGWAITDADQREDFAILRELGATVVRLCHYQHDQLFYSLCDAGGIGVWAELCFVNQPPRTPEGLANAKEQLRELIRQNYNHPSILFWSIGNETSGTDGAADRLLGDLAAIVHEEDPTRPSVYASHHEEKDPRNFRSDLLAVNKYFGWYRGTYADLGVWLDQFHRDHPDRPLGISEYGAGASIYQHEENPPIRISQARGPWHPEEWQARFHEENWLQIKARPYLWGTFVWNLFDFASAGRKEGDHEGRNDKGLVTDDRQVRKDAFYWYQANWTTLPMVHIVSKRFTDRVVPRTEIRIYSNAEEVDVTLNGTSLGKKSAFDHRFVWPAVDLKPGPNRVEATALVKGRPVATDFGCWTYRAPGDPLPNLPVAQAEASPSKK